MAVRNYLSDIPSEYPTLHAIAITNCGYAFQTLLHSFTVLREAGKLK